MDRNGFYLLFIPGLTLATIAVSFAYMAFAMTQGTFQTGTKRGLASLVLTLVVGVLLFAAAHGYQPVKHG